MIQDIDYLKSFDTLDHAFLPLLGQKLTMRSPMPNAPIGSHELEPALNRSSALVKAIGLQNKQNLSNTERPIVLRSCSSRRTFASFS